AAGVAVVVGGLQLPGLAEAMAVLDEGHVVGGVPVRPVLGGGGAGWPLRLGAVVVAEQQRPPHDPVGLRTLVRPAHRQGAVLADLAIDHAIGEVAFVAVGAQPGIALLVRGDHPPGPAAVGGERGRVVGLGAQRVPGTAADPQRSLALVGRTLAYVIDGAGGVADAGQQAVGATDHLHLLVAGGVERTGGDAPAVRHADAIDLGVEDVEAARAVAGAVGLPLVHLHAGGQAQGL